MIKKLSSCGISDVYCTQGIGANSDDEFLDAGSADVISVPRESNHHSNSSNESDNAQQEPQLVCRYPIRKTRKQFSYKF